LAEELLAVAQKDASDFALTWAHMAVGQTHYLLGNLQAAAEHAEAALRRYHEEDHRGWPTDPATLAHSILTFSLALRGFPERARVAIDKLLIDAERLEIASQRAVADLDAGSAYWYLRDVNAVAAHADRLLNTSLEHQLLLYTAWSHLYRGWALAFQGETEEGISELRDGLTGYAATSQRTAAGQYLGCLAEAQLLAGHVNDGLATIEEALSAVPEERIFVPELLRLRGELRAADGADVATVEASFNEAIALAREIGTKLVELRATTSLARFLARHGRTAEARAVLVPLYGTFTEGGEAPDLVEAKVLLDHIG